MGAGGVGGYFGARLAAAGDEVAFIARGAHKDAMKANGLKVRSPLGDVHLEAVEVMDDPDDVGLCDIILFCVKLWDVEAAAETIRPLLSNDTCVAPIQNGVSVTAALSRLLGVKHVIGAVTQISASIEAPGVIRHHGDFARLIFGELDGSDSWRTECLEAACASAGIEARVSKTIEVDIWEKFVFLAPWPARPRSTARPSARSGTSPSAARASRPCCARPPRSAAPRGWRCPTGWRNASSASSNACRRR